MKVRARRSNCAWRWCGSVEASSAWPAPKFKVGDWVIWTNAYGVNWGARRIAKVEGPDKWGHLYYIEPTDTPWMHVREANLELTSDDFGIF